MTVEPLYEVVTPVPRNVQERIPVNVRPANLSNKTIGFVWDYLFDGPIFFDAIRRVIDSTFTGVRFVEHEFFGNISTTEPRQLFEELPDKLHAAGIDVAVVAVGA